MPLNETGFNEWAGAYDADIANSKGYPFEGYYQVLAKVQQLIHIDGDTQLLDIGIGTGALTHELYKQNAQIVGLDFSQKMLDLAAVKMPNARFIQHDFSEALPAIVKSQKFDYILSSYAVHHIVDAAKVKFIKQLQEILKPAGKIIIADVSFPDTTAHDACKLAAGKAWDDSEYYFVADKMIAALKEAGLRVVYEQMSFCAGIYIIQ